MYKDDELFMFKPDAETLTITKKTALRLKESLNCLGFL